MQHRIPFAIALTVAALALTGCASTAGVADSAISTNLEFEQVQNKTLLLNVVRSSLRRPPVYHALTSVNGSVRPSGEVSLTVPFANALSAGSAGVTITGNDGPEVQAAPLDTQEFYQGLLKPIDLATIDFYVQQGYPKSLLFNLFFNRIELKSGSTVIQFRNYAGDDKELDPFQTLVDKLIARGLTTELRSGGPSTFGPDRRTRDLADLAAVARAAAAGLTITKLPQCKPGEEDKSSCVPKGRPDKYRVAKPSGGGEARFCFTSGEGACGTDTSSDDGLSLSVKNPTSLLDEATAAKLCAPKALGDCKVRISLSVRSTDGVIYYLGEVARRRLYPDHPEARTVGYHHRGWGTEPCKLTEDKQTRAMSWPGDCAAIFWVARNEPSDKDIATVSYEGSVFSVPGFMPDRTNPSLGERSSQVVGIVTQLFALNKSAKDSPKASIVNVIGQ